MVPSITNLILLLVSVVLDLKTLDVFSAEVGPFRWGQVRK